MFPTISKLLSASALIVAGMSVALVVAGAPALVPVVYSLAAIALAATAAMLAV